MLVYFCFLWYLLRMRSMMRSFSSCSCGLILLSILEVLILRRSWAMAKFYLRRGWER
jgi:hypothetical protein